MNCRLAGETDLDRYLVDPREERFDAFRRHWPSCPECTRAVLEASRLEADLRSAEASPGARHPHSEMLLLFADGSRVLAPRARDEVARHVAGCRTCADELHALQRVDATRGRGVRLLPDDGSEGALLPIAPHRFQRLRPLLAAASVALLLGTSLWLWRATRHGEPVAPPGAPAIAEQAPTPSAATEPPNEPVSPAPVDEPRIVAAPEVVAPAPASPELAKPAPPRREIATEPKAEKPSPRRAALPKEVATTPAPEPRPVQVAALDPDRLPSYAAPAGASGGWRHAPSAVRSAGDAARLMVLAPDHVGRTGRAAPTLYFHVDRRVEAPIEVTITEPDAIEPIAEFSVAPPTGAGIHAIDLAKRGVTLQPGVTYQWSVSLVLDAEHRAGDVVSSAAIERVAATASQNADALAEAGLFYDALAAVGAEIAADPADARRRARRDALLEQVGLGGIAASDRR